MNIDQKASLALIMLLESMTTLIVLKSRIQDLVFCFGDTGSAVVKRRCFAVLEHRPNGSDDSGDSAGCHCRAPLVRDHRSQVTNRCIFEGRQED